VSTNLIKVEEYRPGRNWIYRGDPCRISGEPGVFRFVALVSDADTGNQWIDVVGPRKNPRNRSFRPERLVRMQAIRCPVCDTRAACNDQCCGVCGTDLTDLPEIWVRK
jgi:hypothetical protein